MTAYETVVPPPGNGADFAVRLEDGELSPWVKPGGTVYVLRRTDLRDGDVGLFYSGGGMTFRQYCRDSEGNVYLFCVDRRRREEDLVIPAGAELPVCYGKAVLKKPIPLPTD